MIRFTLIVLCIAWMKLSVYAQNDPSEQKLKKPLAELHLTQAAAVSINPDSIQQLVTLNGQGYGHQRSHNIFESILNAIIDS